ncbi:hypothetical protein [Dactylosporangium sp. CA-233914]|uniref:hypothetical protein n=1 Tax=Dactylosporangium sp. CA-233914 TaxID=3239934 RepID=UPI003D89B902
MTRLLPVGARVHPAEVGGLFLVGGGSRVPLVATMLHEALGVAPTWPGSPSSSLPLALCA